MVSFFLTNSEEKVYFQVVHFKGLLPLLSVVSNEEQPRFIEDL